MAGRVRYLLYREGRYYARLVVPVDLRPHLEGKTELRKPLGADHRSAMKLHPGAVAELQHRIAVAEAEAARAKGVPMTERARYPMNPEALAWAHYRSRLALDEALRDDPRYAQGTVDDLLVRRLRDGIAGRLSNEELEAVIGDQLERFRRLGNINAPKGSSEWRAAARALCVAELEALGRVMERDEGDYAGRPEHPLLAIETVTDVLPPVSLRGLFGDYIKASKAVGRGDSTEKRWAPAIDSLRKHLGHDDARRITKGDLLAWRDGLLGELSAKTVADVHLASVRAILKWAHENDRLPENVAAGVKQEKPKAVRTREKGYTDDEAQALLAAAKSYVPKVGHSASTTEKASLTRAKRWVPWLCAFTGARAGEIAQLRGQDFRQDGAGWVMRISPEAGTVKSGNFRDVPVHPQLVELGLIDVVTAVGAGPLFYDGTGRDPVKASRMVSGRISTWVRDLAVAPESVAPSHGWRHRFKSVAMDLGIAGRVIDALQDHAARTAGESYGDVSLLAKRKAVEAFPAYVV